MKTNQNNSTLNLGYFLFTTIFFIAFCLLFADYISQFSSFLSSIGESHLMKKNH